jgi:hypothetical protein
MILLIFFSYTKLVKDLIQVVSTNTEALKELKSSVDALPGLLLQYLVAYKADK